MSKKCWNQNYWLQGQFCWPKATPRYMSGPLFTKYPREAFDRTKNHFSRQKKKKIGDLGSLTVKAEVQ